jgi:hypothetical protein
MNDMPKEVNSADEAASNREQELRLPKDTQQLPYASDGWEIDLARRELRASAECRQNQDLVPSAAGGDLGLKLGSRGRRSRTCCPAPSGILSRLFCSLVRRHFSGILRTT